METLRRELSELERNLQAADLPESSKITLRTDIQTIRSDIDSITHDKKKRHYAALAAVRVVLTPLPVLLPLLAEPTQFKGASVLIASYIKTSIITLGLMGTPTADSKVIKRHAMNRDFANVFQALLLISNLIPTEGARKVSESASYNAAAALAGFAALMLMFYGGALVKGQYNRARHGAATHGELSKLADRLPQESKDFLRQWGGRIGGLRANLQNERADFKASSHRLSDTADWQVGQILNGQLALQRDLLRLGGASETSNSVSDPDKLSKAIMFGVSAAVLAAPIVPVTGLFISPKPEMIPLVDLLTDYAFTMFHMGAIWMNPNASLQEAQDAFKQWVGYSGILAYFFGANAATGDQVSKGGKAFAAFATSLSIANSTIATPQGVLMAEVVTAIFAKCRSGDADGARRDLQAVGEAVIQELDVLQPEDHHDISDEAGAGGPAGR